jgi:hypothetical protein
VNVRTTSRKGQCNREPTNSGPNNSDPFIA